MRDACCGDGGSVTAVTSKNVKRRPPFGGRLFARLGHSQIVFVAEKFLGLHSHYTGEGKESDEVGNGHQAVEGIG